MARSSTVPIFRFIRVICLAEPSIYEETILAVPRENVSSGICGQCSPRSDCAFAQSDQGLHCPLTVNGYYQWKAKDR